MLPCIGQGLQALCKGLDALEHFALLLMFNSSRSMPASTLVARPYSTTPAARAGHSPSSTRLNSSIFTSTTLSVPPAKEAANGLPRGPMNSLASGSRSRPPMTRSSTSRKQTANLPNSTSRPTMPSRESSAHTGAFDCDSLTCTRGCVPPAFLLSFLYLTTRLQFGPAILLDPFWTVQGCYDHRSHAFGALYKKVHAAGSSTFDDQISADASHDTLLALLSFLGGPDVEEYVRLFLEVVPFEAA